MGSFGNRFLGEFHNHVSASHFFVFFFFFFCLFLSFSHGFSISVRGEESKPTTDEDCVIDVSSVFSVFLCSCVLRHRRLLNFLGAHRVSSIFSLYAVRRRIKIHHQLTNLSVLMASPPTLKLGFNWRSSVWRSASGKYVTFSHLLSGLVCLIVALWFM